jgi:glycosyltransferase involved in cell wall biosynthesis
MDELAGQFAGIGPVLRAPYRNTYDRPSRSLGAAADRAAAERAARDWRGFDLVHLNKQNLEDGLDLLRAAGLAGRPTVCTVHLTQTARYLEARFAGARDFVARRALLRYPGIFAAVLEKRRAELAQFLGPAGRVVAIPNGVPVPAAAAAPGSRGRFRVVGVGRMVPQKRPLLFLEHAAEIVRQVPGAEVVWVGDGPLAPEWDRAVAAAGMEGKITRAGWRDDVGAFLAEADLFLHVAEYEGLPLAILEAMAAGLPCAVTRNLADELDCLNPGNRWIVGETAWGEVFADRARLAAMGAAARETIRERYSCGAMAAAYEELYRRAGA